MQNQTAPAPPQPMITTYTGRTVNPLALTAENVDVRDVAHALALCNRFAGHTRKPISVAQHSCYAAALVPPNVMLRALLHDAAEAYLGDVTKWLKAQPEMKSYREAEERTQAAVYRRFGLPPVHPDHDLEILKADRLLVRYEGLKGFGRGWSVANLNPRARPHYPDLTSEEVAGLDELHGGWEFWSWRRAELEFMTTFGRAVTTPGTHNESQPCT